MILPSEYIGVKDKSNSSHNFIIQVWSLLNSEVPIYTFVFFTKSFFETHSGCYSSGII